MTTIHQITFFMLSVTFILSDKSLSTCWKAGGMKETLSASHLTLSARHLQDIWSMFFFFFKEYHDHRLSARVGNSAAALQYWIWHFHCKYCKVEQAAASIHPPPHAAACVTHDTTCNKINSVNSSQLLARWLSCVFVCCYGERDKKKTCNLQPCIREIRGAWDHPWPGLTLNSCTEGAR